MGRNRGTNSPPPDNQEQGTALGAEDLWSWEGYQFTSHPRPTYRRYREMVRTDGTMRGLDSAIQLTLRSVTPRVEPGGSDGDGDEEAEFVRSVLLNAPQDGGMTTKIADIQAHLAMASRYGIEFMEKVWWRIPVGDHKGKYGYKKLAHRPATGCKVMPDKNGTFNGFRQEDYRPDGTRVDKYFPPLLSFVYIRGQQESLLTGVSALEAAYHHWLDKKDGIKLWKENQATFAMGMLVGKYPRGMGKDKRDKFFKMIQSIRGAGRAAISLDEEIEILRSSGVGEFRDFCDYMDAQAAISTLAQGLRIGQSDSPQGLGGGGIAQTHQDLFLMACDTELQMQGEALTEYFAAPLVDENFGDNPTYPVVTFPKLQDGAKQAALSIWSEYVKARGLDPALNEVLEEMSLDVMGVDEKRIEKAREEKGTSPVGGDEPLNGGRRVRDADADNDGFVQEARKAIQGIRNGGGR